MNRTPDRIAARLRNMGVELEALATELRAEARDLVERTKENPRCSSSSGKVRCELIPGHGGPHRAKKSTKSNANLTWPNPCGLSLHEHGNFYTCSREKGHDGLHRHLVTW